MYIIAVYDICTEGTGNLRLNKVFKLFKQYLIHVQKSVFEGNLSRAKYEISKRKVYKLINSNVDSVIFFVSREERWMTKEVLGLGEGLTDNIL